MSPSRQAPNQQPTPHDDLDDLVFGVVEPDAIPIASTGDLIGFPILVLSAKQTATKYGDALLVRCVAMDRQSGSYTLQGFFTAIGSALFQQLVNGFRVQQRPFWIQLTSVESQNDREYYSLTTADHKAITECVREWAHTIRAAIQETPDIGQLTLSDRPSLPADSDDLPF